MRGAVCNQRFFNVHRYLAANIIISLLSNAPQLKRLLLIYPIKTVSPSGGRKGEKSRQDLSVATPARRQLSQDSFGSSHLLQGDE